MSGILEEAERLLDLGLTSSPDKFVCSSHINDYAVQKFIRYSGHRDKCDYCQKKKSVRPLGELMEFLMEAVCYFYAEPAGFMPYITSEGGYVGSSVLSGQEVLFDKFELDVNDLILEQDIIDSLGDNGWADPNDFYYGPDQSFNYFHWRTFTNLIKHQSRYFFYNSVTFKPNEDYTPNPRMMLQEVGELIKNYNLITKLPPSIALYRCRQIENPGVVTEAKDICSPKVEYIVNANRMSPAGVSMFYAAFDRTTSLRETLDLRRRDLPYYAIATFKSRKTLKLIDLSKIPDLPSVFDPELRDQHKTISFMHDFVRDLTKSISRDGKIHIEYVPTQVITEYFRYIYSVNKKREPDIDGIIYPSSKSKGRNACVLFFDYWESLRELEFNCRSLQHFKVTKI